MTQVISLTGFLQYVILFFIVKLLQEFFILFFEIQILEVVLNHAKVTLCLLIVSKRVYDYFSALIIFIIRFEVLIIYFQENFHF